jgi:hypothetical protein
LLVVVSIGLLAACGDDDDTENGDEVQPAATTATADDGDDSNANGDDEDDSDGGDDNGQGGGGGGTATLIVGDETYEFTDVLCAFSAEEAQNPDFPFNLSAFGESATGARTQLTADIYDPSGEERTEGEGVTHSITLNDIEDFENPSVGWSAPASFELTGSADPFLQIDGKNVSGESTFDDTLTDDVIEEEPGSLEATCP